MTDSENKPPIHKPKVIDWDKVDKMLHIQCTGEEIASILNIDYDTLATACKREKEKPFSEYSKLKREGGKASLRRNQWKLSETNPAMAIFLGKNLLGQKDTQDLAITPKQITQVDENDITEFTEWKLEREEKKALKKLEDQNGGKD